MNTWNLDEAVSHYFDDNWTYDQIGRHYGIHTSSAYVKMGAHQSIAALRAHKAKLRTNKPARSLKATKPNVVAPDSMMEQWARGGAVSTLAREHGIYDAKVTRMIGDHPRFAEYQEQRIAWLRDHPREYNGSHRKVDLNRLKELYNSGATIYAVAEEMGVTHQRVQQLVVKHCHEEHQRRKDDIAQRRGVRLQRQEARRVVREDRHEEVEEALNLYRQGFAVREILPLYPDIKPTTFVAALTAARDADPTFPSERGKRGRPYNWEARTVAAIQNTNTYKEAAEILGLRYTAFMNRLYILRRKGRKI